MQEEKALLLKTSGSAGKGQSTFTKDNTPSKRTIAQTRFTHSQYSCRYWLH